MKKLLFRVLGAVGCALFFASCATSIGLTVNKPPVLDLRGMQKITVMHVIFPGESGGNKLETAYGKYKSTYHWRKPFESDVSEILTDTISKVITDAKAGQLISPKEIYAKIQEPAAVPAPAPDQTPAPTPAPAQPQKPKNFLQKLGDLFDNSDKPAPDQSFDLVFKNAGSIVDGWILVEVTHFSSDYTTRSDKRKNDKGVDEEVRIAEKKLEIEYTVHLIRASDGTTISSSSHSSTASCRKEGPSAELDLDSDVDMARVAIRETIVDLKKDFHPYTARESRKLEKDPTKNADMARAEKLATGKKYADALALYDSVYAQTQLFAAAYNAALMAELGGNIDDAVARMDALSQESGNKKAATELARMKKTADEQARLK
jgi:hypothetical protein